MAAASLLKACYLAYFSKPESDRILYRIIQKHKIRCILELGIGDGQRAVRMIAMAQRCSPGRRISYTGTDLFEGRGQTTGPSVTLKRAHQMLGATEARVRLIPGDPLVALSRTANELTGTDLIVISAHEDPDLIERAWFYLPRVMHAGSCVVRQEIRRDGTTHIRVLAAPEIAGLARKRAPRRAA